MSLLSNFLSSKKQGYSFVLEKHFKGFKAFPMVVHGNPEAEKNNEYFHGSNLSGKTITFIDEGPKRIGIYIDKRKVGTLFDMDCIQKVRKGSFDKIYAKVEDENIIGKKQTETRPRIRLFVHYEGK